MPKPIPVNPPPTKVNPQDAPMPDGAGAPLFAPGDAVRVGDRPAEIVEARTGAHYAIEFTDEKGGTFQWASEDELEPLDGNEDEDGDDDPVALASRRALAADRRLLAAQLRHNQRASAELALENFVARMRADAKMTPAIERALRTVAASTPGALAAAISIVEVMPRIPALANVRREPRRTEPSGAALVGGKAYAEMTLDEKHELALSNRPLFESLRAQHEAERAGTVPPRG